MAKKLIRLTESDLHRIVKESVDKVLKESLGMSDDEWLNDADDEDDYVNRESAIMQRQYYDGENAMDYHPQRNRSTLMGDDFASTYAKSPIFNNYDMIDKVTNHAKKKVGF